MVAADGVLAFDLERGLFLLEGASGRLMTGGGVPFVIAFAYDMLDELAPLDETLPAGLAARAMAAEEA